MRPARIAALVIGCLMVFPALALFLGGGALGMGYAFGRGDDGYFDTTLDRLATPTVALTGEDITFATEPGSPDWVLDMLDADVRLRATNIDSQREVFIGIAREADVDAYLSGVGHDELTDLTDDFDPVYRSRPGGAEIAPPTDQTFWVASAAGDGTQELEWEATTGSWSAVLMNADGSPGVLTDLNVGVKAAFVLPLALLMLGIGALATGVAIGLIIAGARHLGRPDRDVTGPTPPPPVAGPRHEQLSLLAPDESPSPVSLTARLDDDLSRWKWLVKWFLAIPHFIILALLWIAFVVLTLVAGVAIVFTGTYPRGIFDFNVGVMRWSWRVSHYASTGGIGTDRYPPFSLRPEPDDRAALDVVYPEHLSRGLVFVKWLLAIPHLIIVAILGGTSVQWLTVDGDRFSFDLTGGGGVLGLLVLVAGVMLLFRGRYPRPLFDLIIGLNRWIFRTTAYVALMTDDYPPFRLDQGGSEPVPGRSPAPSTGPGSAVDLRVGSGNPPPPPMTNHATPSVSTT